MRFLVIGGTGTAGRPLVAELIHRGHDVRVLSTRGGTADIPGARGYRGDVVTGEGLEEAVRGVDVVVDCMNVETLSRRRATAMFVQGTRRLLAAEQAAGVRHHVLLSIAGIEAVPYPYYVAKLRQEQAVAAGSVPYTVLRATTFHEFVAAVVRRGRFGPFIVVPRMRTAPVAAAEVAHALAEVAEAQPVGRAPDIGGPRQEELVELTRRWVRARGMRAIVVPVAWPGSAGRAMRDGALVPRDGRRGRQTFEQWLAQHG